MAPRKNEDGETQLFSSLDKSTVFQESRAFNESPLNPRKCRIILAKITLLLLRGEPVGRPEATELFFSITKLFQCPDAALRQMTYLAIKELSALADDVMMVTSSLTKDINAKGDLVYRPNAIRALCKITDPSMMGGIERFLKQSITDKNAAVVSAALVGSCHLFGGNREVVKRWANEVNEVLGGSVRGNLNLMKDLQRSTMH